MAWCWRLQKPVRSSTAPSVNRYYLMDDAAMFAEVRLCVLLNDWIRTHRFPVLVREVNTPSLLFAPYFSSPLMWSGCFWAWIHSRADWAAVYGAPCFANSPVRHCFGREVLQSKKPLIIQLIHRINRLMESGIYGDMTNCTERSYALVQARGAEGVGYMERRSPAPGTDNWL